jgi:hypothetical protein
VDHVRKQVGKLVGRRKEGPDFRSAEMTSSRWKKLKKTSLKLKLVSLSLCINKWKTYGRVKV